MKGRNSRKVTDIFDEGEEFKVYFEDHTFTRIPNNK
jgi:hypothetical protein